MEIAVTNPSQSRAVQTYRARLGQRGMARFEVVGLQADRELIRTLAHRLAESGPDAQQLRASVRSTLGGAGGSKGGILAALRASPLVGADLDIHRETTDGRAIDL